MTLARIRLSLGLLLASLLVPAFSHAHPVPRECHDRIITVKLERDKIIVAYRLEVDEFTVVRIDLPAVDDKVNLKTLKTPNECYDAFTRCYATIFAGNLDAKLDGKPLEFRCTQRQHRLTDEKDRPLGHLRCDFVFEADWKLSAEQEHDFTFRECNYELEEGKIDLRLRSGNDVELMSKIEPDKALRERAQRDLKRGEDEKLRKVSARFRVGGAIASASGTDIPVPPQPGTDESVPATATGIEAPITTSQTGHHDLIHFLNDPNRNFWVLMLLVAVFGAAHALTPGHGKTLVAAYLVAERGTAWHALLLGLITTLSHTGAVIILAIVLRHYFKTVKLEDIQYGLELVSGLLIVALGSWLLLRRLSGGADHVHLGGDGHHHHSHGHGAEHSHGHGADHYHDDQGHAHSPASSRLGAWGVIVLGVAGGIIPCWDAVFLLIAFPATALPLVLSFSAGLAATLVAIGIAVVYVKGFSESRWGSGKLIRVLPLISAAFITAMGFWMCYRALHHAA